MPTGGVDACEPLVSLIERWLHDRGLRTRRLLDFAGAETLGIVCDVVGGRPGPQYILDACLDTAPFGDEREWQYGPTSETIDHGWLYGRGAADSKAAIAIFMHIAAHVERHGHSLGGTLTLLLMPMSTPGGSGESRDTSGTSRPPISVE